MSRTKGLGPHERAQVSAILADAGHNVPDTQSTVFDPPSVCAVIERFGYALRESSGGGFDLITSSGRTVYQGVSLDTIMGGFWVALIVIDGYVGLKNADALLGSRASLYGRDDLTELCDGTPFCVFPCNGGLGICLIDWGNGDRAPPWRPGARLVHRDLHC